MKKKTIDELYEQIKDDNHVIEKQDLTLDQKIELLQKGIIAANKILSLKPKTNA